MLGGRRGVEFALSAESDVGDGRLPTLAARVGCGCSLISGHQGLRNLSGLAMARLVWPTVNVVIPPRACIEAATAEEEEKRDLNTNDGGDGLEEPNCICVRHVDSQDLQEAWYIYGYLTLYSLQISPQWS